MGRARFAEEDAGGFAVDTFGFVARVFSGNQPELCLASSRPRYARLLVLLILTIKSILLIPTIAFRGVLFAQLQNTTRCGGSTAAYHLCRF